MLLGFLAVFAALAIAGFLGCSTTGSATADAVIEHSSPGFFQRAWAFVTDIGFPMLVGLLIFTLSGSGSVGAIAATGATAGTARAMRPDPAPTTINKTDIHAAPGSTINVDHPKIDPGTLPAVSEGLMRTIEHYGFYILILYVLWLKRDSWIAFLRGWVVDRVGTPVKIPRTEAFKHALAGGSESRARVFGKIA